MLCQLEEQEFPVAPTGRKLVTLQLLHECLRRDASQDLAAFDRHLIDRLVQCRRVYIAFEDLNIW